MRTYQIMINEQQRAFITRALAAHQPTDLDADATEELAMLRDMFADLVNLPDNETGDHMLHGFTL